MRHRQTSTATRRSRRVGAQRRAREDRGGAMVRTKIGYGLSGLLGAGIIVIGVRFLVVPRTAAAAYGITTEQGGPPSDPYLAAKGVRDIASGVVAFVLLAAGKPHILGGTWPRLASSRSATRSSCCGATAPRQPPTACTAPRQLRCWAQPRSCSADPSDIPWRRRRRAATAKLLLGARGQLKQQSVAVVPRRRGTSSLARN